MTYFNETESRADTPITLENYIDYLNAQIMHAKERNLIKKREYEWLS